MTKRMTSIAIWLTLTSLPVSAEEYSFCHQWSEPKTLGNLNTKLIPEASGMAVSTFSSDRLYWINDSGDKGAFYISHNDGSKARRVRIDDYKPRDTEAMTMVNFPDGPHMVIGDIGDNMSRREHVTLVFIKDRENFGESVTAARRVRLKYPDGAHNAEAMVTLANGDLLIITKEQKYGFMNAEPAILYSVTKSQLLSSTSDSPLTMKRLGILPLQLWLKEEGVMGQVATDAAINVRRGVLGILTYERAVEIPLKNLDRLDQSLQWKAGVDYSIVPLKSLVQQEAMTYMAKDDRVVWATEQSGQEAPIFSMTCSQIKP